MAWSDFTAPLSAAIDFFGQERANRENKDIWRKTQDWQEYMSGSAWQRGVRDMKAAGINPMVAFSQGGASTPAGTIGAPMRSPTAGMVHSAVAAARTKAEIDNLRKQNEKLDADTALSRANKFLADEQKKLTANSAKKVDVDTQKARATEKPFRLLGDIGDYVYDRIKHSSHSAKSVQLSRGLFGK